MPAGVRAPNKVQANYTVPEHIDALVREAAAKRRVRNSTVAVEIFAKHFGVSPFTEAEQQSPKKTPHRP